jgi:hypothetical protein
MIVPRWNAISCTLRPKFFIGVLVTPRRLHGNKYGGSSEGLRATCNAAAHVDAEEKKWRICAPKITSAL